MRVCAAAGGAGPWRIDQWRGELPCKSWRSPHREEVEAVGEWGGIGRGRGVEGRRGKESRVQVMGEGK